MKKKSKIAFGRLDLLRNDTLNNKSKIPKYFQLQTWLQDRIEQGYYSTNEKIPTENELVKMSGLSRAN